MKGENVQENPQPDKNRTLQKFEVPFFEKPGCRTRLYGKSTRDRVFHEIEELISDDVISTHELSTRPGKNPRQTRRGSFHW